MRILTIIVVLTLFMGSGSAGAADAAKTRALIDTGRTALEDLRGKAGENKAVAADLETAAQYLDRAAAALKGGEKIFGGISDEAEQDVRHQTSLAELTLKLAASRIERAKIEAELDAINKKSEIVKSRVKIFDDLRAEIARLKEAVSANEKAGKGLAALQAERDALAEQVRKLTGENALLEKLRQENDMLRKELSRRQDERAQTTQPERAGNPQPDPKELETIPAPQPEPAAVPSPAPDPKPSLEEIVQPDNSGK
ncbi:hypothetical protein OR1_01851 [Geobacter sp. OR-1]|uniref:hypothetical protein n=1 Tax=Geobacter sp. OR-1 TaxID=1266765 RepID=UPI00054343C5|nr:hypothetical protein [Geobacter sp. OR-1]GAM09571.1 hypothetical protein OR1_01851 [Geobacter sp. OR-1]